MIPRENEIFYTQETQWLGEMLAGYVDTAWLGEALEEAEMRKLCTMGASD